MTIPGLLLKQLYTFGSLMNVEGGVKFSIKNRLSDAVLTGIQSVKFNGAEVPKDDIKIDFGDGQFFSPDQISLNCPLDFPLRKTLDIIARTVALPLGKHQIEVEFDTRPFGELRLKVNCAIAEVDDHLLRVPRSVTDDYSPEVIEKRQEFVEQFSRVQLQHLKHYSFDPHLTKGNCEQFTGVAQVPLGFAGPLQVNGEHAQGEFLIPLATTEGTLVASYNRGIKVLNLCGGVKCTVVGDAMQRAPVFVFDDARAGRKFEKWVQAHLEKIREQAEITSSVAKLKYIDFYLANKFVFLINEAIPMLAADDESAFANGGQDGVTGGFGEKVRQPGIRHFKVLDGLLRLGLQIFGAGGESWEQNRDQQRGQECGLAYSFHNIYLSSFRFSFWSSCFGEARGSSCEFVTAAGATCYLHD
jgi:hydroxymethylglutaryl-CoA reductase (NADPH)